MDKCKQCQGQAEVTEGGETYCRGCLYNLWQEYIRVVSGRDPGNPDDYPFRKLTTPEMAEDKPQPTPLERSLRVLALVFDGLHNVPRPYLVTDEERGHVEVRVPNIGMASFDSARMTRLVFAAHDMCVRALLQPHTFTHQKLFLYPRRGRTGSINDRHPTLEDAVANWRTAYGADTVFTDPESGGGGRRLPT